MTGIEKVLSIFNEINTVPRQSHHLEKIHPWLMNWAESRGFKTKTDSFKNICISVPATKGCEQTPVIVIQGHMDMVCEKRPDIEHDFQRDPIVSWRDGDWLRAKGTSLGADNAIALALAFDLITDPEAVHPPLEILITSDEETGLVGAQNIQPGFITGKILINLDSEDEGVFTAGCAGGQDMDLTLPVRQEPVPADYERRRLCIGGLQGGHSGVEIHLNRANANVLLMRALRELTNSVPGIRIGALSGGSAHNAIPREAQAVAAVPADKLEVLQKSVKKFETALRTELRDTEPRFFTALENDVPADCLLFGETDGQRLTDALRLIPHGVKYMSTVFEDTVDTSMNFAIMRTEPDRVKVLTNFRSASALRLGDFAETMCGLARLCGGSCQSGNNYPAWEPVKSSGLLERCQRIWKDLFDSDPVVEVTHAGLECGAIGACVPGLDMISFGLDIRQPHSPDERMNIPSADRIRTFFRELIKSYAVVSV